MATNYFERNHPRRVVELGKGSNTVATFRCPVCKKSHIIPGSRQKWNAVFRKFKRYCAKCYREKFGEEPAK